ncbi:Rpn family recombination-promoting nuclease/putative transposase, partial [[Clostridium] innocuum]|nr:Rpn family recombination-promoting nuclease/putative transposase [[Clostridium] innocuum]
LKKKKMVLDIRVKDSEGREYGIEMQTTYSKKSELKRFELYGARMLSNQLDNGEKYYELLPVYQIIFLDSYAEHTRKLIDAYQMRNEEGEVESKRSLMRRIYIYLPEINAIVKRKGFEKLNDFEQLCYLFKNNDEDDILKTEERLVKKVMEKYRKFHDAEDLWSIAMATQIQEQREKNAILDSFEDGVEQGIKQGVEQGQEEGVRMLLRRQMESKYHEDCSAWLCSLTMEQLNLVSSLLFTCDTLQELKNQLTIHI